MDKREFGEKINSIIGGDAPISAELYMCTKENDNHALRRIQLKNETAKEFSHAFSQLLREKYIDSEVEIKSMENIEDNQKILYTLTQTKEYSPFDFLNKGNIEIYNSEQSIIWLGYFIKLGNSENYVYLYQARNNTLTLNNDKTFFIKRTVNNVFVSVDDEFLRIEKRIDVIILGNDIFSERINVLQRTFGLEKYIRKSAKAAIDKIAALNIMSSTEVFFRFESKLKNSKKLMKIKDSPVLNMSKERLLKKINEIERYKSIINVQDNQIIVNTQKDVDNVLKLFGDAILKSELTDEEYETMIKVRLDKM